jgi:non-specific serine/threonine protein kinase
MRPVLSLAFALLATAPACISSPQPELTGPSVAVSVAWDLLPDAPIVRTEVAAAAVGGRVVVIGGLGPAGPADGQRVDIFDPADNTWSVGPGLPVPLHHTAALVVGAKVYLLGGYGGQQFVPLSTTWVLDTSLPQLAQAWLPFVPLPTPRGAHGAATDGHSLWVFGGVGPLPNQLDATAYRLDLAEGAAGAWLPIANFPDPRDHLTGGFLGGKVLAVGGRDLTLATNTGRLDLYDPATNTWARGPDMPTPRGGIGSAVAGGRLWVFGGEAAGGATFAQAEGYDPAANAWISVTPMPHSRHGVGVAALDGAVYVESGGPVAGFTYSAYNERMRLLG